MSLSPFESPLHLPFNRHALEERFELQTPDRASGPAAGPQVVLRGTELLLAEADRELVLPDRTPPLAGSPPLHIGRFAGRPCRASQVPRQTAVPDGYAWEDLLRAEPRISAELLSIGGLAGQILHWERNSRHCSRCGGGMERIAGQWGKQCLPCDYAHFPHIHPCVIVLVRRGVEVLLTRKAAWPAGRYSLVAGFVDFGECLEEAVVREVKEETGVAVEGVRYVGSQSWPFPSQLMAGFVAEYAGGEVRVEEAELEDARWFPVDALPVLPPRRSIARYLLDRYLP